MLRAIVSRDLVRAHLVSPAQGIQGFTGANHVHAAVACSRLHLGTWRRCIGKCNGRAGRNRITGTGNLQALADGEGIRRTNIVGAGKLTDGKTVGAGQ